MLVDKFTYHGSSVSSTENDINMQLAKACTAIDRLSIIWKSDLSDKIKRNFFKQRKECYKLYWTNPGSNTPQSGSCTATTLLISKTIQIRWTGHIGHCWRSEDELISDVLPWTSSHGRSSVGRPTKTYLQQLCMDTEYSLEDLLEAIGW